MPRRTWDEGIQGSVNNHIQITQQWVELGGDINFCVVSRLFVAVERCAERQLLNDFSPSALTVGSWIVPMRNMASRDHAGQEDIGVFLFLLLRVVVSLGFGRSHVLSSRAREIVAGSRSSGTFACLMGLCLRDVGNCCALPMSTRHGQASPLCQEAPWLYILIHTGDLP